MKKSIIRAFIFAVGVQVCALAVAQLFPSGSGYKSYTGFLSNETALAYNKQFAIDLSPYNAAGVSAEVIYGSATISNVTFVDGAQSTGSFTVANYLGLSSASATAQFTVVSTNSISGANLRIGPNVLTNGPNWQTGASKQLTAVSIASAIQTIPGFTASANSGVVYTTAPFGSVYNNWNFSSDNSSITASAAKLAGGADNAVITINSVSITANLDYQAVTSSVTTAANIVTAINAKAALSPTLKATSGVVLASDYGVVNLKSIFNGSAYNYALTTSTPTAISESGANMVNGTDPQDIFNSSIFKQSAPHSLTTALPVLYTAGSAAIGGLTDQTTYYAIPTTSYNFQLARCSSCAVNGNARDIIVVTSTNTQIFSSMHTYTIHPLAISGTPSFKWQVSNDNSTWLDLGVSSVTISSYTPGNAVAGWDFGSLGLRYLRLNALAPSTGGIVLQTTVNFKQ